jgi:chitin synthase
MDFYHICLVLEEDTYILTTDADIKFDADSVEALLDRLIRDPNVGAVCGRTHPLGHGPLIWYQMFDYAIGHWLQKVLLPKKHQLKMRRFNLSNTHRN